MEDLIAAQNKAEEEAAEWEQDTVPPFVFEWALPEETEEQPADESPPQLVSVTERVVYTRNHKKYTAQYLKDLYKTLALNPPIAKNSSKQVVFNAIRDCSDAKINKIDDNMFEYTSEQLPLHLQKGPKWTMLLGEEIQMPDGFGYSGVEEGFFGPTNKENAEGQPKRSYLRDNPVPRPQFTAKARKGQPSPSDAAPNKQGSVSDYAKKQLPAYLIYRSLQNSSRETWWQLRTSVRQPKELPTSNHST